MKNIGIPVAFYLYLEVAKQPSSIKSSRKAERNE